MKSIPIRTLTLALALVSPAPAQVVELKFTEVLVDPVGSNSGKQVIEFQNTGNVHIDTTGWYLAVGAAAVALPKLTIPVDTLGRIHLGQQGTSSKADIYLPAAPDLRASDTLTFFSSNAFTDPRAVVDFVSWGGGQVHIAVAVQANQWKSSFDTVTLPSSEGHTIAHYLRDTWGFGNAAEDWYQDGTPTLGTANDPGSMFNVVEGCPGIQNRPSMGLINPKTRPWTGETWELDLYNLPQSRGTALVAFGLSRIFPIPLDGAGLTGCNLHLGIDVLIVVPRNLGWGLVKSLVPNDPTLVGVEFYVQAMIQDQTYQNPARAMVTNLLIGKIGSR